MSNIYKAKKSCQVLGTQSLEDVLVYLSFPVAFFYSEVFVVSFIDASASYVSCIEVVTYSMMWLVFS